MDFPTCCCFATFLISQKAFLTLCQYSIFKKKKIQTFPHSGVFGASTVPKSVLLLNCHCLDIPWISLSERATTQNNRFSVMQRRLSEPSASSLVILLWLFLISTQIFQISEMVSFLEAFPQPPHLLPTRYYVL